ncbi:AraC family transcriptional regulator [Paenibacillus whitsoniae]|uniref:AraC family transcriptional regulator n=1 Tax=Paenibacillus whitsoniae TaxID=2496558 RepID=A0A3S0BGL8_9BACL|nr:AraC family transcriptional regulator [Paenibacillus whitsoniae]RTE02068.1 AraC family transcriptional regulator [Paenibacillus whitsoniae]
MTQKPLFSLSPGDTLSELRDTYFPPYITLAHTFNAPAGWGISHRVLKQFQLQYVLSGCAQYTIEGKSFLTQKGDLLFHRPGERHSVSTIPGEPYVCLSLVFHFGQSAFPMDELLPGANDLGNFACHEVERKLTSLVIHYRQPGLVHQLQAQTLLMELLLMFNRLAGERSVQEASAAQRNNFTRLVLAKNHIIEHFAKEMMIKDLEAITGFSGDYLIVQFKKTFGMTPIQYQIHLRVEKAKELAVHEGLTPSEVAQRVGYRDIHTFGKMFKKKTGTSLSQFCATLFTEDWDPEI